MCKREQYKEAIEIYDQAIELNPNIAIVSPRVVALSNSTKSVQDGPEISKIQTASSDL